MEQYKKYNDPNFIKNEKQDVLLDFYKNYRIEIIKIDPVSELQQCKDIKNLDRAILTRMTEKLEANYEWQPEEQATGTANPALDT